MLAIVAIIVGLAGALVGVAAGMLYRRRAEGTSLQQAEEQASRTLAEAESKKQTLLSEAHEERLQQRKAFDEEVREQRLQT